jgi:hypothetical protein
MVIVYCFILIILSLISTFTYKKALTKIDTAEMYNNISKEDADTIAKNMMEQNKVSIQSVSQPMQQSETPIMKSQTLPEPIANIKPSDDIPGYPESISMYDEGSNFMELESQSMKLEKFANLQKNKEPSNGAVPEPFSDDSNFSPLLV